MMALVLQQFLERASVSTSKLAGFRFGFHQAELSEIEFGVETGAGLLSARLENVSADYDLGVPKVEAILVGRAQLKFAYQDHPANKTGIADPNAPSPVAFPLERLSVEKLDIDIDTPWGLSRFSGRGEIKRGDANAIEVSFLDAGQSLRFKFSPDFGTARVSAERLPGGKVFELNAEHLTQPNKHANLHADAASFVEWLNASSLVPETLRTNMSTSGISQATPSLSSTRLAINLATPDNIETLQGSMSLTRDSRELVHADLSMATRHQTVVDVDGRLDMAATELFGLLKPWLPQTTGDWQFSTGTVQGAMNLRWQPNRNSSGTAHLKASDLALSIGSVKVQNGSIAVTIADIAKHSMALSANVPKLELGADMAAADLIVNAHYIGQDLTVERAAMAMFGGLLEVLPNTVNINQLPVILTLRLQDVDLSQLLSSLKYQDLSGSGTVSGELPLRLSREAIELQDGMLTGVHPGVIRYQGPVADNENIAFKALRNLAYHSLQAKVNYRPNGDYHLGFRIKGSNPEVLSGHPLAFNLNVSGQLPELLRRGFVAGDFERAILEQATARPTPPEKPAKPLPKPPEGDQQPTPPPADRRSQ